MTARQAQFRKGGGFLNNVDATFTAYQFTDEFNGEAFKPGIDPKTKKKRFHALYSLVSLLVEGATEDTTTTLFVGGYDDFDVSDDGHTITPKEDGRGVGANSAWAKLITSLEEKGVACENGDYPVGVYNYEPILGVRAHLIQRPLSAAEIADLKRRNKATTRKGKDGREYEIRDLVVEEVLELPAAAGKSNGKTATPASAKTAGKTVSKTVSKTSKPAPVETEEAEDVDIASLSTETLVGILATTKDNSIAKAKLSMKVLTSLMKHPEREAVRTWLFNDENLAQLAAEGVISFNKAKGLIASA